MMCFCTINKDITVLFDNRSKQPGAMLACFIPSGTTELTRQELKLPFLCDMCMCILNAHYSTVVGPLLPVMTCMSLHVTQGENVLSIIVP